MPITFRCPHCGQELTAPDQAAGQSGKCRFCQATVQAPLAPGEPAQLIQPGGAPTPPQPGVGAPGAGAPGAGAPGTDLPPGYGAPSPPPGAGGPGSDVPPPGGYAAPGAYPGYAAPGYGAPGYGAPAAYPPSGVVDPAAILGGAWQFMFGNWGILVGVTLIIMILGMLVNGVTSALQAAGLGDSPMVMAAISIIVSLGLVPLQQGGPYHIAHNIVQGGAGEIGDLFKPYQRTGSWIGLYLLQLIIFIPAALLIGGGAFMLASDTSGAAGILLIILGIVAMVATLTGMSLAPIMMVDRGIGPLEAIQESWSAVTPHFLTVFLTQFLLGLASVAGILLCCVGFLLTYHFMFVGNTLIYRELRGFSNLGD